MWRLDVWCYRLVVVGVGGSSFFTWHCWTRQLCATHCPSKRSKTQAMSAKTINRKPDIFGLRREPWFRQRRAGGRPPLTDGGVALAFPKVGGRGTVPLHPSSSPPHTLIIDRSEPGIQKVTEPLGLCSSPEFVHLIPTGAVYAYGSPCMARNSALPWAFLLRRDSSTVQKFRPRVHDWRVPPDSSQGLGPCIVSPPLNTRVARSMAQRVVFDKATAPATLHNRDI